MFRRDIRRNRSARRIPPPTQIREVPPPTTETISWSERDQNKPWKYTPDCIVMTKVPVKCVMAGIGHLPVWEEGDLQIPPGCDVVPVIISDSMLKEVARHPRAIMIVRCGGTTNELVDCVAQ